MRKTYFTDKVTIAQNSLVIPKMREISFEEIANYKTISIRGFSVYLITLKEGRRIAIGPTNNFTEDAGDIFQNFKIRFEKKIVNTIYNK